MGLLLAEADLLLLLLAKFGAECSFRTLLGALARDSCLKEGEEAEEMDVELSSFRSAVAGRLPLFACKHELALV